ncbi:MAG TPA: cobalamin-dependent protein [bacterium]|nr:cobalamin-dependent protein [bacterium]
MRPRILLSSVFKPFGVDNMYSRKGSKIELFHNQITQFQGVFSLRSHMYSYGLHAIANNIDAPTTVLEFPSFERFRTEIKKGYDIVGIGAYMPNFQKVKRMVEETRKLSPRSTIVLGGFCAAVPDLEKMMDVDYVCIGDGVTFMRDLLGMSKDFTFRDAEMYGEAREMLGVPVFGLRKYPYIVVGLGCSYGCDFCCPSHFFGRKHIKFFTGGREIFETMVRIERKYRSNLICLIGDDNFLLDLKRAEELRKCVADSGKVFNMLVFGSSDQAVEFGPEKLAEMGAGTLWIGRESMFGGYRKNADMNIKGLVAELKRYGIKTILSSILLLDQHTKENIVTDIDDHLACKPTMSQFAHLAPVPGTPLFDRMREDRRILTAIPFEDWNYFTQPWYTHPHFSLTEAQEVQARAYLRDFHELGPSLLRYLETEYEGWRNLKDSGKPHLRARAAYFAGEMRKYKVLLLAMEHLAPTEEMRDMVREVRGRVEGSFGRANALEQAVARGIFVAGRFREFRTRHWGDAIQPRTIVKYYNQDRKV